MTGVFPTAPTSNEDVEALRRELAETRARLREAEETVEAIRAGEVDAVVVGSADGPTVYTLETEDRPYRRLIEQIGEGALTLSGDGVILYCNRRLAALLRTPQEHVIGGTLRRFVEADEIDALEALTAGGDGRREFTLRTASGAALPVVLSLSELGGDGPRTLCAVVTDVSDQKQAEAALRDANARLLAEAAERERTETMLRQSQKMEAVGQLTGGIAHDFNNMLQGIAGSLELIQTRLAQGRTEEVGRFALAAMTSVTRAAALTHRLLAFARRQALDSRPVNVNQLVVGMEELIRRTVGPAIVVEMVISGGLWPTLCDANQLENALLNLAINARDAMPEGGRLTVETANAHLDEAYARSQGDGLKPGQYVAVSVTDTGTGMPAEVAAQVFEPFFTTKPLGEGTGLGLSMLYGFVKQSEGHVRVYSEEGRGTTMRLYLPRHHVGETEADIAAADSAGADQAEAGETVLVVEDEAVVRQLVVEVLQELGYAALEATDGPAGLRVLQSGARVDLLVTDVGLPGLNGRQLADAARERRPGLRVLFITGYAHNAALGNGVLEPGMAMISKPFTLAALAAKIRAMIKG